MVWLFKTFFGEQQKPADMPPSDRVGRSPSTPRPYRIETNQPKTLEEILAEVRQNAERRRQPGGYAPPPPPPPMRRAPPPPPPPPPPKRKRTLVEQLEAKDKALEKELAPPPVQADGREIKALQPKLDPSSAAPQPPAIKAPAASSATPVQRHDVPVPTPRNEAWAYFCALKQAPPAKRQAAMRRAVILQEVLGPPRALKPYRPRGMA